MIDLKKKKPVLAIIPVYNEEPNIVKVVESLNPYRDFLDYMIVNDGSVDGTKDICTKNHYHVLHLPVKLGLSGAFQSGMRYAAKHGYDYAVQFDGDGQHKPCYIWDMLDKAEQGYDIVIGSRFIGKKESASLRMMGSNLIRSLIRLTSGKVLTDPTSGMRMFNRQMICEFAEGINYGPEPDTISYLLKHGVTVTEVAVEMAEREYGESYLNLKNAVNYMMRICLSILLVQGFRVRPRSTALEYRKQGE